MPNFIVYSAERTRIGLLQDEECVQWLEHYAGPGEVKITARATKANMALLALGNRVYNTDATSAAVICNVTLLEETRENTIVARAAITSQLLDTRVVMASYAAQNAEAAMYDVLRINLRGLPLALAASNGYPEASGAELSWGSVLNAEKTLASAAGLGFCVDFEPKSGRETFRVYKGVLRHNAQQPGYVGYFGADVGNLSSVQIENGNADYKNVAVVAGPMENGERIVRTVSAAAFANEARRELYVDARDASREYRTAIPTGGQDAYGNPAYTYQKNTYTNEEYENVLKARGLLALGECPQNLAVKCAVHQVGIHFGKDYFLGDVMPLRLSEYGLWAAAQVCSAKRVYEKGKTTTEITFSNFRMEAQHGPA